MKRQPSKMFERLENQGFSRKAQGISINVIIVAAIALIVLVVLIAVFTGRISLFGLGIDEAQKCVSLGGEPTLRSECDQVLPGRYLDVEGDNICCSKKKVG
ncbi:hypothetical protein GOV09_02520 [Candidatus Woesearchaeota archaeon]|nr:hypothetical protein [Candidatus Woesearchaeota archaeon]